MHIAFASIAGLNETHKYDTKLWGREGDGNHGDRTERGVEFGLIVVCVRCCVMCVVVVCVMCGEFSVIVL